MNSYIILLLCFIAAIIFLTVRGVINDKKKRDEFLKASIDSFGAFNTISFSEDELARVKKLFYTLKDENFIDEISAGDLDIDAFYKKVNRCLSNPGQEYFYYLLRRQRLENSELEDLESSVSYLETHEKERNSLISYFARLRGTGKVFFFDALNHVCSLKEVNFLKELIYPIILIISILCLFISSKLGITLIIVSLTINIYTYYRKKGELSDCTYCLNFLSKLAKASEGLSNEHIEGLTAELEPLKKLTKEVSGLKQLSFFVSSDSETGSGNPFELIFVYLKILFHIDILVLAREMRLVKDKKDSLKEIYLRIGRIESYISIASLRKGFKDVCVPGHFNGIKAKGLYHPLISNPVKNDISEERGVLITGSNASGKSTFLKTVALNVLFAGNIHTCFADSFEADDYYVFSSMSLKDSLESKDSFYMAEIKALKRIFDFHEEHPDRKIVCFIDELLKGTNTVERIALATQILLNLKKEGVLTYAATHDYELADILDEEYSNYHFTEEIVNDDISFNFLFAPGKAVSKNAIKLLRLLGFSDEIVNDAKKMADGFLESGVWK